MYIVLTVQLHTQHYVSAVFADFHVIGGDGIPHPFGPMLLLCLYGILVVGYVTFRDGIGKDALLLL